MVSPVSEPAGSRKPPITGRMAAVKSNPTSTRTACRARNRIMMASGNTGSLYSFAFGQDNRRSVLNWKNERDVLYHQLSDLRDTPRESHLTGTAATLFEGSG